MSKKRIRLSELDPLEVSLVTMGANGKKKFLTLKSANGEVQMEEVIKKILENDLENESEIDAILKEAKLSEDDAKATKASLNILSSVQKGFPKDFDLSTLVAKVGFPFPKKDDKGKKNPKEDDELAKLKKENAELRKKGNVKKEEPPKKEDDPMKDLPEAVKKRFEAVEKANKDEIEKREKVEKALEVEKNARVTKEFQEKAAVYKHLATTPEKLGAILKNASETMSEESFEAFEGVLKTSNENLRLNTALKVVGAGGQGDGGDAWKKIEKMAEKLVLKGDTELTKEQAIERVLKTDEGKKLEKEYYKQEREA